MDDDGALPAGVWWWWNGMEWNGMEWNGMEWNENVNWMDETAERFFFPRAAPRDHTIALAAFGGYSRRC